jgi:hypothetical protein
MIRGASPLGLPNTSLDWRGALQPAKLTSLREPFAARSAPFARSLKPNGRFAVGAVAR